MSIVDSVIFNNKVISKKTYTYDDVAYYKVMGMNTQYFIKVSDYHKVTLCQKAVELYQYSVSGLLKVKAYIKSIDSSDILLIAAPTISSNFKMFDLEKAPCIN